MQPGTLKSKCTYGRRALLFFSYRFKVLPYILLLERGIEEIKEEAKGTSTKSNNKQVLKDRQHGAQTLGGFFTVTDSHCKDARAGNSTNLIHRSENKLWHITELT